MERPNQLNLEMPEFKTFVSKDRMKKEKQKLKKESDQFVRKQEQPERQDAVRKMKHDTRLAPRNQVQKVQQQPPAQPPVHKGGWVKDGARMRVQINVEIDIDETKPLVSTEIPEPSAEIRDKKMDDLKDIFIRSLSFDALESELTEKVCMLRREITDEDVLALLGNHPFENSEYGEKVIEAMKTNKGENIIEALKEKDKYTLHDIALTTFVLSTCSLERSNIRKDFQLEALTTVLELIDAQVLVVQNLDVNNDSAKAKLIVKYFVRVAVIKLLSQATGATIMQRQGTKTLMLGADDGVIPHLQNKMQLKLAESHKALIAQGLQRVSIWTSANHGRAYSKKVHEVGCVHVFKDDSKNAKFSAKTAMMEMIGKKDGFIPGIDIMYSTDDSRMVKISKKELDAVVAFLNKQLPDNFGVEGKSDGEGFVVKKKENGFWTTNYKYEEMTDMIFDKGTFAKVSYALGSLLKEMLMVRTKVTVSMWAYCGLDILKPSVVTLEVTPKSDSKIEDGFDYSDDLDELEKEFGQL